MGTPASHIPKADLPLYCTGTSCVQNGVTATECCDARAACAAADCGSTHVLKPQALLNLFLANGLCAGPTCSLGERCNPRPACSESVCDPSTHVFSPSVALCASTSCEVT